MRDQVAGREKTVAGGKKDIGRMREESAGRDGERKVGSEDRARGTGHGSLWSTPKNNRKIKSEKMFIVKKVEGTGKREDDDIQEAEIDENQQDEEHQILATPSRTRAMLGPTPQKDGVVLGLFDLLSPSVGISSTGAVDAVGIGARSITTATTPNKGDRSRLREITGNSTASFQMMTPRKNRYGAFGGIGANGENIFDAAAAAGGTAGDGIENDFVNRKGSRTPASAGKRFLLDSFVTPRKRRRCDGAGSADATPSSVAKRFMTPQFLRREAPVMMDTLVEDDGDGAGAGAGAVVGDGLDSLDIKVGLPSRARQPWKRKGLVRSLSSMIQGLRKQEDERLDEEMDIMDEIEGGGGGGGTTLLKEKRKKEQTGDKDENEAMMAVAESQIASTMDADGLVSLVEDGAGEGDVAVPARKKKGQKRQTRRAIRELHTLSYLISNMMYSTIIYATYANAITAVRPTKGKSKQQQQQSQAEFHTALPSDGEDELHTGSGSGRKKIDVELEEGNKHKGEIKSGSIKDSASKSKEEASITKPKDTTTSGKGKRVRKVSEQAHANYRRLKIKSKQSKGSGKRRFGRGRR